MTKVKVEVVTKSKSGKALRVKFAGNDTWYGARLDAKLEAAKGKMIEAELHEDETDGRQIDMWAFAQEGAPQTAAPANGNGHGQTNGSDRWWLSFCSNQVAHAIASGQIKDPSEIGRWAKGAYDAINAVDSL